MTTERTNKEAVRTGCIVLVVLLTVIIFAIYGVIEFIKDLL